MDTNQVVQKILNDAKVAADKIKADADTKLKAFNDANSRELADFEQETQRLCEKVFAENKERILAITRMESSKQETETKRQMLNKVIENTAEKIKSMNDAEYLNLMEGLIIASVKTRSEELVIGKNEKRINEDFVRKINQKLGEKGKLQIAADKADMEGGFILRQGKRRVNASLDVMLKVAAQELEGKLSEILFG
jgi:V/A-type H+-transporting ATPase subunit E